MPPPAPRSCEAQALALRTRAVAPLPSPFRRPLPAARCCAALAPRQPPRRRLQRRPAGPSSASAAAAGRGGEGPGAAAPGSSWSDDDDDFPPSEDEAAASPSAPAPLPPKPAEPSSQPPTAAAAPAQEAQQAPQEGPATRPRRGVASLADLLASEEFRGVGLFVAAGAALAFLLYTWTTARAVGGAGLLQAWRRRPYSFDLTFDQAPKVRAGTPLKLKGADVGEVSDVRVQLDRVALTLEVNDAAVTIPRDATFLLCQTGMVPASHIDIAPPPGFAVSQLHTPPPPAPATDDGLPPAGTAPAAGAAAEGAEAGSNAAGDSSQPQLPLPLPKLLGRQQAGKAWRLASPREVDACRAQGRIVCAGDKMAGQLGGSFDELTRRSLEGFKGSGVARPQ